MLSYNFLRTSCMAMMVVMLTGCSFGFSSHKKDGGPGKHIDLRHVKNAKPRVLPKSQYGNPRSYVALGKRYHVLSSARGYNKTGIASWYGTKFHGKLTSTREPYDMYAMTAASTELPLPTFVRVTNLKNHKQIIVKVNDRGPFAHKRILDLSYAAAQKLDILKNGTGFVRVAAIDPRYYRAEAPPQTMVRQPPKAPPQLAFAPPPSEHEPQIFLQLGAFSDASNAKQLKQQLALQAIHFPVQIQNIHNHERTYYKVTMGPIQTVAQTDQLIEKLTGMGLPTDLQITD